TGGPAIVHLDVDPTEIGRNYATAVGLAGDARLGLADLAAALRARAARPRPNPLLECQGEVAAFWAEFEAKAAATTAPIKPQRVFQALARLLPAGSIVVADAGTPTP